jgi:peroxiredoxin
VIRVGDTAPALAGQPVFGLPFALDRARHRGSVAVAFLAALSARATHQNLAALTSIWPRVDAEAGGIVVVSASPLETARDFVPRHHVLFPMLVDETGEAASAWGVGRARGLSAAIRRARPTFVHNAMSVWRNGQPLPERNVDQLPAIFVVNPDGRVALAWYGDAVEARFDAEAAWSAMRG